MSEIIDLLPRELMLMSENYFVMPGKIVLIPQSHILMSGFHMFFVRQTHFENKALTAMNR